MQSTLAIPNTQTASFPNHVPSLVNCSRFQVKGNIYFDAELILEGNVSIQQVGNAPMQLKSTPFTLQDANAEMFA